MLEEVDQFKYLGSTQTNDRASINEVKTDWYKHTQPDKASNTVEK